MQRVPEPELMSDYKQAQAYAAADFAEPHEQFVVKLREKFPNLPRNGRALDLGCGPGDVTRRFARAFPAWTIDAIDGSAAMLDIGRQTTIDEGLDARIHFHELVLPADSLPQGDYDFILSNSLLHHLRDPLVLWSAIGQCSRPGIGIFVMDLMRPANRLAASALVEQYAADEPHVLRTDFFNSLLAAYTPTEVQRQLAVIGLHELQMEVVSDRHWIVWGIASCPIPKT